MRILLITQENLKGSSMATLEDWLAESMDCVFFLENKIQMLENQKQLHEIPHLHTLAEIAEINIELIESEITLRLNNGTEAVYTSDIPCFDIILN